MKHIALITWIAGGNFGTSLQCFALNKFLTDHGYNCTYLWQPQVHISFLKGIMKRLFTALGVLQLRDEYRLRKRLDYKKQKKLKRFLDENIKQFRVRDNRQLEQFVQSIDVLCVGSDQVWNAYYNFDPFNFLSFGGETKRISFASSVGTKNFPAEHSAKIEKLLKKFDHISVREETGREAIVELTGRTDIKTVLDPTFLLTDKDWKCVGENAKIEINVPKKYILVYFVGQNPSYREQLERVRKETCINDIIVIPLIEDSSINSIEGAIVYREAAISEFVSLIEQAAWVCTDSFHATAISINLSQNFTEFLRFKDADRASQNSRIYDILDTFGLSDRLYNKDNKAWAEPIAYNQIARKLANLRKDSTDWLLNAIEN